MTQAAMQEVTAMDGPLPENLTDLWKTFFEEFSYRESGHDLYPEIFLGDLFPLQRQNELKRMIKYARSIAPKTVMDIGSDKGGGLYHWCKCLPSVTRVVACEIRGLPYAKLFDEAFPNIEFCWLPRSSWDLQNVGLVKRWLYAISREPGGIDVLFLDGDKSFFHLDFQHYAPEVHEGGLVFFHDITDPSPGASYHACCLHSLAGSRLDILDTSEVDDVIGHKSPRNSYESWLAHWRGKSAGVGMIQIKHPK